MWYLLALTITASAQQAFNFYLFEMEWKPASCLIPKHCTNPQYLGNEFNIHGLWPTFAYNEHNPNCCSGLPFKVEEIDPKTLDSMQKHWMSYKNSAPRGCQEKPELRKYREGVYSLRSTGADNPSHYGNDYSQEETAFHSEQLHDHATAESYSIKFWTHEWEKHGTCSNLSIKDYFSTAVQLYQTLQIEQKLAIAGLAVGADYPAEKVLAALGDGAVILCVKGNGVINLKTVRFCYTKDLKIMKCPNAPLNFDCNGPVHLPAAH